jgi:Protein of unknown function (DUF3618)
MSDQATDGGTPPQTPDALAAEIEQTRQELGETVEALVAKTDVKARAQRRAAEAAADLRGKAHAAMSKARGGVRDASHKAAEAKEKAAEQAPALRPTGSAQVYIAAAAVTAASIVAWLTVRRRRR